MFAQNRAHRPGCKVFQAFLALFVCLIATSAAAQRAAAPSAAESAPSTACDDRDLLAGKTPSDQQNLTGEVSLMTDATVDADGADWDAPSAVTMMGSGFATYDLGAPTELRALYIQADANDVYRVSGSLDGTPGSFKVIAQLENVRDRGHGLRQRTATFQPEIGRAHV